MKYFLLSIAVMIGSGLLLGKLASDFVGSEIEYQKQRKEVIYNVK